MMHALCYTLGALQHAIQARAERLALIRECGMRGRIPSLFSRQLSIAISPFPSLRDDAVKSRINSSTCLKLLLLFSRACCILRNGFYASLSLALQYSLWVLHTNVGER